MDNYNSKKYNNSFKAEKNSVETNNKNSQNQQSKKLELFSKYSAEKDDIKFDLSSVDASFSAYKKGKKTFGLYAKSGKDMQKNNSYYFDPNSDTQTPEQQQNTSNVDTQNVEEPFKEQASQQNSASAFSLETQTLIAGDEKTDIKFDLDAISKTFQAYKKGGLFEGVVVVKKTEGVVFNIGGKNDAFIACDDFDDYANVKIGDRFSAILTGNKTEDGLVCASKKEAEDIVFGNQNANRLKVGSSFSFVPTSAESGLCSKMGQFKIFVPAKEVSIYHESNLQKYVGQDLKAVVLEIDKNAKQIVASVKLLQEQQKEQAEILFWRSMFVNKIVFGTVKKIMPYGAFVTVEDIDCFVHISNLSYQRIDDVSQVLEVGKKYQFKIIKLDYENKKVELSLKALLKDPKQQLLQNLKPGDIMQGEVIKILKFGAIIKLKNGITGLLHVSNATDNLSKRIYEIVKLGQQVSVQVISVDEESQKVSFKLV